MANIEAIFFWMSGVVTQSIPAILQNFMAAEARPGLVNYPSPIINQALERFSLGQLDDLAFCQQLIEYGSLPVEPAHLRQKVVDAIAPNEAALAVIEKLPADFQRWLIVDLPRAWYEQIAGRLTLAEAFQSENLIFLPESGLSRLVPELYSFLCNTARLQTENCLLIDPSLKRSIQGINLGFSAAHYVNPRLLEREFYLRGFFGRITIHKKPGLGVSP